MSTLVNGVTALYEGYRYTFKNSLYASEILILKECGRRANFQ